MKQRWSPTPESFEKLLLWLGANREEGAKRYEAIRQRLVMYFGCNNCGDADEYLADETIDRLMKKLERDEIPEPFTGDRELYFLSFARNIRREHHAARGREVPRLVIDPDRIQVEAEDACLAECVRVLQQEDRWLAIEYYRFDRTTKIAHHSDLADRSHLSKAGLRTRIHRIRAQLRPCIKECLDRRAQ